MVSAHRGLNRTKLNICSESVGICSADLRSDSQLNPTVDALGHANLGLSQSGIDLFPHLGYPGLQIAPCLQLGLEILKQFK